MVDISKQVYGDANKKFEEFHGDGKNTGNINVYNNSVTNGHESFKNFTENSFLGNKKVADHAKSIGGLFAWIRKLSVIDSTFADIKFRAAWGNGNPEVRIGDIQLLEPNKGYSKNWGGELQVEGNDPAKKILATIKTTNGDLKTNIGGHNDNLPLFWEIWDARETAGSAKGGLQEDQAKIICDSIKNQAIASNNQGDILSALDTLMFATQIFPLPDTYKTTEVKKYFDRIALLESQNPRPFKEIIPTDLEKNFLLEARKRWLDDLTTEIIDKYIADIYTKASDAIDWQNFNFRKPDGSKFSDEEIKKFYSDQGKRDAQGKLENFTLGKNLEQIKEDVAKSLDIFKAKVQEIRQAYSSEFDATGPSNINVVKPWKDAVDKGAQVIGNLLESKIKNLNNKIEAKIDEKSDYLSDLFREADFYIKHDKPLPTFLLDPANSYTELGIVYKEKVPKELDSEGKPKIEDPLFGGKSDGEVIVRLATFKFDLTGYPAEDLRKSGFEVTKTDTVIRDEKKNTIKTKDKAHVFYGMNNPVNDIKNVKFFIKDSDLKEVNDKISAFGISFKKHDTENYYQVQGDFNDEAGLENYFKSDREKIEIEKTYWTLTANNPKGDAEKAEDIKKLFLSAPGRPRQVPNIYVDKNNGSEPEQIYSREFLAVYQKGLVDEIKDAAKNNKDNKVQVNKCYFFTGEGKTHVIQRITNDIKFRKKANALLGLGGTSNEEVVVLDFNLQNDDVEEIKKKIVIETLLSINPDKGYGDLLKSKTLSELIAELGNNKGNKKFNFIIQADEDPHMRRKVKKTLYNIHDFLTEECKLIKDDSLGSINLISISGTPKQKRHDHLVDKIIGYVDSKEWFEKNGDVRQGKKSEYTNTETGKKEIRALENFQAAYKNIAGLFDQNALDRTDDKSIEDRIVKNVGGVSLIKKYNDDKGNEVINARHIQYLMPDLSAMDSALLFAPTRLEKLVQGILNKPDIAGKDEFFVLLPPVADSVAKEMRSRVDDLSKLTLEQKNYIGLLEKKKIVQFKKVGSEWKLTSIVEGLEKELDKEENSKKDSICFYDQNTVVGGDYGKFSRDVTDFYIDDLSGREFGTDDLAQWIARNRTMNLRDDSIVSKVKKQCNFYYAGTSGNLTRIQENAKKSADLVSAQLEVINASELEIQGKIKNYQDNARNLIKPANDNDLTPLKKITERLNRLKLTPKEIDDVIQTLDEYADGKSIFNKTSSTQDPISTNLLSDIIIFSGKILPEDKKLTANLYAKEYVEAQRTGRNKPQSIKSVNLTLFDRATSSDELSKKLETYSDAASLQKLNSIDECNLRDVFSLREIRISGQKSARDKKISSLKVKLGFDDETELLPNYTILDVVSNMMDSKYSRSDVKSAIRSLTLEKHLNVTLDEFNGTVKDLTDNVTKILEELDKNKENKKESSKLLDRRIENAKIASMAVDGNITMTNIKIDFPDVFLGIKEDKEISITFDKGDGKKNLYRKLAKKEAKKIEKDLAKEYNLKKELEEVKKLYSDLNPNLSNKYDLLPLDQKLDGTELTSEALKPKLEASIKALKADIIAFKTEGEKNILAEAERYLPNSHIERINQSDMADYLKESKAKYATANIDNIDNIRSIKITDPNNLLFNKSDKGITDMTASHKSGIGDNREYLVKKLLSSLNLETNILPGSGNDYDLNIIVEKDGKIKVQDENNKDLIKNPKLKPFKSIEQTGHQILAYSEGNLAKRLVAKREKKASPEKENKIQLYYSKPGSDQDNCFIDENDSTTTIPHLSIQFSQANERRVVDAAISKTAYNDVLKYTAEVEEKVRECINNGHGINGALIQNDVANKITDPELKKFVQLATPVPVNVDGKNFANVLERKEATNGDHLVKLNFLVDKRIIGKSEKIEIPDDAPKLRYVQVNGTGIFEQRVLKMKFTLDNDGELKYEGIFEKYETTGSIEFRKVETKDLTAEEKKLIAKMKVVATRQVVDHTRTSDKFSLDQVIVVEKDHIKNKDSVKSFSNTIKLTATDFDKANFDMKPNSLIKNPEAIKVMAGRLIKSH